MPKDPAASGKATEAASKGGDSFWGFLGPILGAVGTGIGIIGFVIFIGGFIFWTRFDAAGIPADHAISEVPRNDLVASGADFLVFALLIALAAVAIAVVVWSFFVGDRRAGRIGRAEDEHDSAITGLDKLNDQGERLKHELGVLKLEMERQDQAAKDADPDSAERKAARKKYDAADTRWRELKDELKELQDEKIPAAKHKVTQKERALEQARNPDKKENWIQVLVGGLPMLGAGIYLIASAASGIGFWPTVFLVVVLALLLGLSIAVLRMTRHFAWFAVAMFLGIGVLIACSTYWRTKSNTKESPVAVLTSDGPVNGFFVAETSDAVYIAQPQQTLDRPTKLDHTAITLTRVPMSSLTGLTVGPLMAEAQAYRRSLQLGLALCQKQRQTAAAQKAAQAKAPAGTGTTAGSGATGTTSGTASSPAPSTVAPPATTTTPQPAVGCTPADFRTLRRILASLQV
jgi:hypothetical protein